MNALRTAVLIPCLDEEISIGKVVRDFRSALPGAKIFVYDNGSRDNTVDQARAAGAQVRIESRRGKGHVVRRMFSDIDADIYLLVDGDNTYEAAAAPRLIEALIERSLDMVTGCRITGEKSAYRTGHRFGNRLLTRLVTRILAADSRDMLSGYRALSRRFVKSFPALSQGFEIETELTVHALELCMPIADLDTSYTERMAGSASKLSTVSDGMRIMRTIATLIRDERPLQFFSLVAGACAILSLALAYPVVVEYLKTGLVPRFPTAILAAAIMICAMLSVFSGLILDTVTRGRREFKRLAYLAHDSVPATLEKLVP